MKKFHIDITETYRKTIEVEAESKEHAEHLYYDKDKGEVVNYKTIDYDDEITEVN